MTKNKIRDLQDDQSSAQCLDEDPGHLGLDTIPDGLGRGISSTTEIPKALIVHPEGAEVESLNEIYFDFDFVDSRSSFSKMITWSTKTKFSFTSASASARAEGARNYKSSRQRIDLVLIKTVHKNKWFLRDPQARQEAVELAKNDMNSFVLRYGDQFIRSAVRGGLMALIYRFDFENTERAEEFRAKVSGEYMRSKAEASMSRSLLSMVINTSVSVEGICIGVDEAPAVFSSSKGAEKSTGEIRNNEEAVTALIDYFQNFENNVTDDSAATIYFDIAEMGDIVNLPPVPDHRVYRYALEEAADLDDEIDKRLWQVDYLDHTAGPWNPHVTKNDIQSIRTALVDIRDRLSQSVRLVGDLKSKSLSIGKPDIPSLPVSWIARDLKEVGSAAIEIVNSRSSAEYKIPQLVVGQYVGIKIYASRSRDKTGHSNFSVAWVMTDGSLSNIIQDINLYYLHSFATTIYELPPANAVALFVRGISYNNTHFQLRATLLI